MLPSDLTATQLSDVLNNGSDHLEHENTGPGKFEGNDNPGLAEALYEATLEGWCDDEVGTVEDPGGWNGLLGRFIVTEDDRGFFSYEEFDSCEKAESVFRRIDPYGPESGEEGDEA